MDMGFVEFMRTALPTARSLTDQQANLINRIADPDFQANRPGQVVERPIREPLMGRNNHPPGALTQARELRENRYSF